MPAPSRHRRGRPYARARVRMFEEYGTTCHLCGHGGADSADHLVPVSLDPEQPIDHRMMRPAHGVHGCPTCGRKCNQERGNGAMFEPLNTSRHW